MAHAESLDATLGALAAASRDVPLLIVPGGGSFADAIRDADRRLGLTDDAAHWMAVLAMDQYAHLIASRLPNGVLVSGPADIESALAQRQLPVLAPYQWTREADPLPHSWDVTSDSVAAWVAGQVGASRLVLVKPPGASGSNLVDPYFHRVLPSHIKAEIIAADRFVAAGL
jgi:5-(aminomethyl)-3-furanmethanol phosphate kinase